MYLYTYTCTCTCTCTCIDVHLHCMYTMHVLWYMCRYTIHSPLDLPPSLLSSLPLFLSPSQSKFEVLEAEVKEINTNKETLKRNLLDLIELQHILQKTQVFFEEVVREGRSKSCLMYTCTCICGVEVVRGRGFVAFRLWLLQMHPYFYIQCTCMHCTYMYVYWCICTYTRTVGGIEKFPFRFRATVLPCYRFRATERKRSCNAGYRSVQRSVPFKRKKLFRRLIERCDRFACEVPSSPCPFRILTKNHLQLAVFCRSLCGLPLTVCFVKVARYLLPSDRSLSPLCLSLSPSGLSLSPSLGSLAISFESLAISFGSLAISFPRFARYLLPSGLSLSPSFRSLAISFVRVAR